MTVGRLETTCCIAGGGPAGLMLGYLLARAGVAVTVMEQHGDFLRDFRGDTIHPSTMEVMHQLGLLDEFLGLPHQPVPELWIRVGGERIRVADFSHLPVQAPYIAMMPQWDFLDFIARKAAELPTFTLRMGTRAVDLLTEGRRVAGVLAEGPEGQLVVRAALTVGADGRGSRLRSASGLAVTDFGAPMDVLWFRLSRAPGDTDETQGLFESGRIVVMLNRGSYWQCACVIAKNGFAALRDAGLGGFRDGLRAMLPVAPDRVDELRSWDQVKLLNVQVNRMPVWWRTGLLCIGDSAHAMSPVGGVGVNLAVQDAVAAANLLAPSLRRGEAADRDLAAVQARRDWPTRAVQAVQLNVQRRVIAPVLGGGAPLSMPAVLRRLARLPGFVRIPARLVGMGPRPESVDPDILHQAG